MKGGSIQSEWIGARYLPLSGGTMTGDIALGANKLKTTTHYLYEEDINQLSIKRISDNARMGLILGALQFLEQIKAGGDAMPINVSDVDARYIKFQARDSGVGLVEVARIQGAADPYFQMTLPFRILPVATAALPGTPVEGMLAYDVTAHKLKVRVAAAWETITSA